MASFGHLSVRIWIKPFSNDEKDPLAHFCLCQMDFLGTAMASRICSRSTLVVPNAFHINQKTLSPDACRSKCESGMRKGALARHPSIQTRFENFRTLEPLVLSSESNFDVWQESDRCKKVLVSSNGNRAPPGNETPPHPSA